MSDEEQDYLPKKFLAGAVTQPEISAWLRKCACLCVFVEACYKHVKIQCSPYIPQNMSVCYRAPHPDTERSNIKCQIPTIVIRFQDVCPRRSEIRNLAGRTRSKKEIEKEGLEALKEGMGTSLFEGRNLARLEVREMR